MSAIGRGSQLHSLAAAQSGWPEWIDPTASRELQAILRAGQLTHAYLLTGPSGVGKRELALAFAQTVCCTASDTVSGARPCGTCRACRNVLRGAHPDVERYDLASQGAQSDRPGRGANLSIDTMRQLRAAAALLPLEAPRRIMIVDDAETLQEPAQQALLKTLEEPPPTVILLLLCDEPEALLATVRSRCRTIIVRPAPVNVVAQALQCNGLSPDQAEEIARLSRGSGAWAWQAAHDASLVQVRREARDTARAWVAASRYERLVTAYKLGEQFGKRRNEVLGIVQAAIQTLRDGMLRSVELDEGPQSEGDVGHGAVGSWADAIKSSLQCLKDLDANVRPRLALEAMVLAWPKWDQPRS